MRSRHGPAPQGAQTGLLSTFALGVPPPKVPRQRVEPISLRSQAGWPAPEMPSPASTVSVGRMIAWHMPEPGSLKASQLQPRQQPPASYLVCFFFFLKGHLNVVHKALGTPLHPPIPSLRPACCQHRAQTREWPNQPLCSTGHQMHVDGTQPRLAFGAIDWPVLHHSLTTASGYPRPFHGWENVPLVQAGQTWCPQCPCPPPE